MESLLRCLDDEQGWYASLATHPTAEAARARPRDDEQAEPGARPLALTPLTSSRQRRRARRTSPSPLRELGLADINTLVTRTPTAIAATPASAAGARKGAACAPTPSPAKALLLAKLHVEFSCSVCHDLCVRPHTTACGHSFCALCLRRSVSACGAHCPLCRQPLPRDAGALATNSAMWSAIELLFPREVRELESEHARQEQLDMEAHRAAEQGAESARAERRGAALRARGARVLLAAGSAPLLHGARFVEPGNGAFAHGYAGSGAETELDEDETSDGGWDAHGDGRMFSGGDESSGDDADGSGGWAAPPPPLHAARLAELDAAPHGLPSFVSAHAVWQMQLAHPDATPSRIFARAPRSSGAAAAVPAGAFALVRVGAVSPSASGDGARRVAAASVEGEGREQRA
ncbi:hypothetical protein KFE25_007694 [Diacronema lutheri]|uniref:RING-type E3 ubiquitin transferase n=1 Tax=Diacronema lutheri TaxID=2081491 RepID=A0A8J6CFJ1_DIALT|nr:hypothetical protein KFE25_007694 [Diacronema lutheri]